METPAQTPQQKYRATEKCKIARKRYYDNKGKATAQSYYQKNREVILERSKQRYINLKEAQNNLENDLTTT